MPQAVRDRIFVSYSHKDQAWLDRFRTMLQPAQRATGLELWSDKRIEAGASWKDEITTAIDTARVALLLVSDDFLASDFIFDEELPRILQQHQSRGLLIRWVPLSAALVERTPLAKFQAAAGCDPAHPLDQLDEAACTRSIADVCREILGVLGQYSSLDGDARDQLKAKVQAAVGPNVRLEEELGGGDFSITYAGRQGLRSVAVKAIIEPPMHSWADEAFQLRAEKAARLRDRHFIHVYDFVFDQDPRCLVMERVEAPTLADQLELEADRRLPGIEGGVHPRPARFGLDRGARGRVGPRRAAAGEHLPRRGGSPLLGPGPVERDAALGADAGWVHGRLRPGHLHDPRAVRRRADHAAERPVCLGPPGSRAAQRRAARPGAAGHGFRAEAGLLRLPLAGVRTLAAHPSRPRRHPAAAPGAVAPGALWLDGGGRRAAQGGDSSTSVGLDPAVEAAKASFNRCCAGNTTFYQRFYDLLQRTCPEVRPYFAALDLRRQGAMLDQAIEQMLNFQPGPEPTTLSRTALRHAHLGLRPEHFDQFLQAFVRALDEFGQEGEPALDAWRHVLGPGIEYMKERCRAAAEVAGAPTTTPVVPASPPSLPRCSRPDQRVERPGRRRVG